MTAQDVSPRRQTPLSFMTTLSPWVRVYRPSKEPKPGYRPVTAGQTTSQITAIEPTPAETTPDAGTTEDQTTGETLPSKTNTVEAPADTTAGETTKESKPEIEKAIPVDTAAANAPALIILFPWFSANPGAVEKYINAYRSIYPSAEILLVFTSMKQLLWRPGRKTPDVDPAISIIKVIASTISVKTGTLEKPRILVHAFSNGGSAMLARVREAYGDPFPPHVTIFDSGPGLYSFSRCLNGATSGLPGWLWVAVWPGSALITLSYAALYAGRRDAFRCWFEMHNEVAGEVRRTYICSEADEMIAMSHVERNAREAEEKGYDVRFERFNGSAHVSHMRLDETRYWTIIHETWQGPRPLQDAMLEYGRVDDGTSEEAASSTWHAKQSESQARNDPLTTGTNTASSVENSMILQY